MSHRNNPPRQSPAQRGPRVTIAHNNEASVGSTPGNRRKAILDVNNGNAEYGAGQAPGSNGEPITQGDFMPSTW
jgi:hypothetical protein